MVSKGYENCLLVMRRLKEEWVLKTIDRNPLRRIIVDVTEIAHPPSVGGIINALVDAGFLERIDNYTYKILKYEKD